MEIRDMDEYTDKKTRVNILRLRVYEEVCLLEELYREISGKAIEFHELDNAARSGASAIILGLLKQRILSGANEMKKEET